MFSTRTAAPRAALLALFLSFFVAVPAAGAAERPRAACADALCKRDRADTPSCWRFTQRGQISRCFIRRAARHYKQSIPEALHIAHRESRYDWRVTNRSSGAAGLFQFMPRTWRFTPYRHHSAHHPRWAALAAMWMWKKGYKSHWSL